jgi:hypothetical protein
MKAIKRTRKAKLLLGFLAKGEVDAIFKQNPFEVPQSNNNPIQLWRQSSDAVARLPFTPPVAGVEVLDSGAWPIVEEIKARSTYKKYYESIADYQFAMVPISSLLAPQWLADMDYIDELSCRISSDASLDEQIRFAMAEGVVAEPIVAGPQVIFTSRGRDLHAEQIPSVRQVGDSEYEIVVRAGSRPNYIQAAAIGNRLLLINGVHKVCALLLKGYTHVPCVLRCISRIEESGLNLQTSLFRPELLGGARPAQVVDFLNEDVAVSVLMRSMHQVLTVGIGIGTMQVPAISQLPPAAQVVGDVAQATMLMVPKTGDATGAEADAGSRRVS